MTEVKEPSIVLGLWFARHLWRRYLSKWSFAGRSRGESLSRTRSSTVRSRAASVLLVFDWVGVGSDWVIIFSSFSFGEKAG